MSSQAPQPSFVLRGHEALVHCVQISPFDPAFLIASDDAGKVVGWSLQTRRSLFSMQASDSPVLAVRCLSRSTVLTQAKDGIINLWDVEYSGTPSHRLAEGSIKGEQHTFCKCDIIRDDGKAAQLVAFAQGSDGIGVWDLRSSDPVSVLKPPGSKRSSGFCTAMVAVGDKHVVGGYEDGGVRLFDLRKNLAVLQEHVHSDPVFGLDAVRTRSDRSGAEAFAVMSGSANGELVLSRLTASDGGERDMVLTEKGRMQLKCAEEARGVNHLCARPDGKIFGAACWDGRIRIYAVKNPRILASLKWHSKNVQCIAFSPDSQLMATGSDDTRIAVWEIFTERGKEEV
uniref:Anaphase-promoting complex subunit 4 WD40 domain-containing protein n=1 Tax=Guillardia theta TaxID=55529 RepID=A0A7S4N095_GUITH|mmetsp:Transcript_1456/g.4409  ORF Transcript_1456/g.4409 Transcript_1456/m.4409 type:complete len:342 (+) Transcript_1456:253-1278(+)